MARHKLPLTVVTAVLNESKTLPGFLRHVTKIAEEVIVVIDFRTTDNTRAIAKKFGCKILQDKGESKEIVFNNKNWGIKEATYPWVFVMDADERMDNRLQEEISNILNQDIEQTANLYQTSFINYEFGKFFDKCDQKNKPFVRLFKKGKFLYKTAQTSEGFGIQSHSLKKLGKFSDLVLRIPILRSKYIERHQGIVTLKGHLIHYSHPIISDFIRKIDLYSSREAKLKLKSNSNPPLYRIFLSMLFEPKKEFIYKFFIWKLYKEGVHGLVASIIYAFYHFLIYAKYYAMVYRQNNRQKILREVRKYNFPHDPYA